MYVRGKRIRDLSLCVGKGKIKIPQNFFKKFKF